MFKAFQKHTIVADGEGYTCLNDTKVPPPQRHNIEKLLAGKNLTFYFFSFSSHLAMPD
jgi:hypothetical protein